MIILLHLSSLVTLSFLIFFYTGKYVPDSLLQVEDRQEINRTPDVCLETLSHPSLHLTAERWRVETEYKHAWFTQRFQNYFGLWRFLTSTFCLLASDEEGENKRRCNKMFWQILAFAICCLFLSFLFLKNASACSFISRLLPCDGPRTPMTSCLLNHNVWIVITAYTWD